MTTFNGNSVKEVVNNTSPLGDPSAISVKDTLSVAASLRLHWPEYLMEAGEMSLFVFCICSLATLLQHPASPVRHFFVSGIVRRALMGLAVGATVMALIMSPWGKQSGGHINPAVTFAFYRLGKLHPWDVLFYGVPQFCGATIGVALATFLLRGAPGDGTVRYAVTALGVYGVAVAFAAEVAISFILMMTVLLVTNHERLARDTPYFVGSLYAANITFETPLSGMSMNAARTLGPAAETVVIDRLLCFGLVLPTAASTLGVRDVCPNFDLPQCLQRVVAVIPLSPTASTGPSGCTRSPTASLLVAHATAAMCSPACGRVSKIVAVSPTSPAATVTATTAPGSRSTACSALCAMCVRPSFIFVMRASGSCGLTQSSFFAASLVDPFPCAHSTNQHCGSHNLFS